MNAAANVLATSLLNHVYKISFFWGKIIKNIPIPILFRHSSFFLSKFFY